MVYYSFDMGYRCKIGETVVYDEVTLPAHSSYDDGIGDLIVPDYLIAESVSFRLMPCLMVYQSLNILGGKIIFHTDFMIFFDVTESSGRIRRFRITVLYRFTGNSIPFGYIFPDTDDVNPFTMLRYAEIHGVHNSGVVGYDIAYFVERILDDVERPSVVMDFETVYIFEEKTFRLFPA